MSESIGKILKDLKPLNSNNSKTIFKQFFIRFELKIYIRIYYMEYFLNEEDQSIGLHGSCQPNNPLLNLVKPLTKISKCLIFSYEFPYQKVKTEINWKKSQQSDKSRDGTRAGSGRVSSSSPEKFRKLLNF